MSDDPQQPTAGDDTGGSTAGSSMSTFLALVEGVLGVNAPEVADDLARRFRPLGVLGEGSYGVVLRVLDLGLGVERAMKLPRGRTLVDPRARAAFVAEARHAAAVDHPNVVRVLEADEVGACCYQVMEYCPEGSLAGWLRARPEAPPIPGRWAAGLVAEMAEGVAALHARGLVHRDLKPGNVLLSRVGPAGDDPPSLRPKVADFGLARPVESADAERSIDGTPVGTLASMSPEAARGLRAHIGPPTDIYSLGTILFELLTRRRPYGGDDRGAVLAQILDDAPSPSPRVHRPDLPRELEILCGSCLSKDPAGRYPTAAALAEDLRRYARGEPVRGTSWWRRARCWARGHRAPLAAAALLVGTIGLGAIGLEYKRRIDAEAWLNNLEAGNLRSLPSLVGGYRPDDLRVARRLVSLYEHGNTPEKRLMAAAALATVRRDCADHALDRLLTAPPESLASIARALDGRVPGLVDRLTAEAGSASPIADLPAAEARDRRRANAAAALILLGHPTPALGLMIDQRDPQARSFLIHLLGPSGVPPSLLLAELRATKDPSIRRSLLQSLGEVPEAAWTGTLRPDAEALRLYEHEPDAGVHGSAKWLLRRWKLTAKCELIDARIASNDYRPGFGWRVCKTGLTLVRVKGLKGLRQPIEVSDCEITVEQFRRFRDGHAIDELVSSFSDSPVNSVDFCDAAAYCNWLAGQEGHPDADLVYRPEGPRLLPAESDGDRPGFRLLDDREFPIVSRAGVDSRHYFGDSAALVASYATCEQGRAPRLVVAGLKPNDLGLFDTVGNVFELTRCTEPDVKRDNQSSLCGGWFLNTRHNASCDLRIPGVSKFQKGANQGYGFRVARTLAGL